MSKLMLMDGHSILNRAFYGVPDLTNAEGFHTNAIYGFLNIMFRFLEEEKPDYFAVAFDLKAPTFRHEMYKEYKGTRKPMPDELRQQVPVMKDVLKAMGILIMEKAGYEADDILGTMAKRAEKQGVEVALISGDRDLLQIATEKIKIRIPKTKGNKTEVEDYYAKDVLEKYHVTPLQFIELKALMGDTADNIPGVPKVGEKTATGLMETYGSIDNIYAHLDEITKNSIRMTLAENRELCDLSLKLATIEIDADIPYDLQMAELGDIYTQEAYEFCQELNFKNMLSRFANTSQPQIELPNITLIDDFGKAEEIFAELEQAEKLAILDFEEGCMSFYDGKEAYFLMPQGFLTEDYLAGKCEELWNHLKDEKKRKLITFDVKKLYPRMNLPYEAHQDFYDVKLAAYLINPNKSEYTIEDVASEYANMMLMDYKQTFGKLDFASVLWQQKEKFLEYVVQRLYSVYHSYTELTNKIDEMQMTQLYETIEMPLTYVLYDMEKEGVIALEDELKAYSQELGDKIDVLTKSIYEQVGEEFNINSPKQLGEILFEKMQIKGGKKTKTGYSTAADVLEKLAVDYPVVRDILEYRGLAKLKATYADGLSGYIEKDGRIHTSFQQMVTATGRLSSTDPNLQNIPMRMEMGRLIRKVFVPKDGCVFMDADYSQIELRILAHMSEDQELIHAYQNAQDIHRLTASKVFNTPFDEVTDLQRRNAKAVNFGIVYGISSFGLSQDLSISKKEAQEYINQYFETYPSIKNFLNQCVEDAKATGYSQTLYGRRRPILELQSSNFMQRQFGERIAMNAPIQGTAADIMKIAMIKIFEEIQAADLKSKLLLQVHDEVLIETYEDEVEKMQEILVRAMRGAVQLSVELEIDIHTGKNWYEAK